MYRINIANVRPWWLRLLLLLFIGVPAIVNLPAYFYSADDPPIELIAFWAGYACFIWLFVALNVGIRALLNMLSGAFILAITTAMLGAAARKAFPWLGEGIGHIDVNLKMATLFLMMISVIPYGLFFVSSFSALGVIDTLSGSGTKISSIRMHVALGLRVLQHVGEVYIRLIAVWSEEHPNILLPRHRRDWNGQWYAKTNIVPWCYDSMKSWMFACMMHTFEPIPVLVNEIYRAAHANTTSGDRNAN
jgi:hypothetical protein